jgi:hypothetical protein
MKILFACSFLAAILFSVTGFANPPGGVGGGHGNSSFGSITGNATPPGLQGRGSPHGLQMQNKTPYGWSQGQKRGWNKHHHHGSHYYNYNHKHINRD